jgi:hypothetical protein
VKLNHKRQETFIKDNNKKSSQFLGKSANPFEILDEVNSDEGYGTNATIYKKVADNNLRNNKHCARVDVLNEQKEFTTKAVWNKSMQHGTHKSNGVARMSQDPDCKGHFKIPTIINGIISVIGNDTSQKEQQHDETDKTKKQQP